MTYEEALKEVNSRLLFGMKPGLERISKLLTRLSNPQEKLKFVHVAGTNGKGTTCTLISSVLRKAGYVTGLYTSPYVIDFRERFQIDGEMISKEELTGEVEIVSKAAKELESSGGAVTEFEFITALAFHWFAARRCDVVVLEVGLGGLYDATNVIGTPEAAAIMSISLDHTAILGDTLEKIAREKAGIIKPGGRVVLYPDQAEEVKAVIRKACEEKGASLVIPKREEASVKGASLQGTEFEIEGLRLQTPFLGEHQVKNALTAYEAVKLLRKRGFSISDEALREGFANAFIPARMEVISKEPLCLLDGGHNPGCAQALKEALERFVPGRRVAVMGMMADKDSREALRIIGPLFSKIVTYAPENPRSLPAEELAKVAGEFCPQVIATKTCGEALAAAMKDLKREDALIVCGSFYLADEIREPLKGKMDNLKAR